MIAFSSLYKMFCGHCNFIRRVSRYCYCRYRSIMNFFLLHYHHSNRRNQYKIYDEQQYALYQKTFFSLPSLSLLVKSRFIKFTLRKYDINSDTAKQRIINRYAGIPSRTIADCKNCIAARKRNGNETGKRRKYKRSKSIIILHSLQKFIFSSSLPFQILLLPFYIC